MAGIAEQADAQPMFLGVDTSSMMYSSIVALERAASLGKRCCVRSQFLKRHPSEAPYLCRTRRKGGRVIGEDAEGAE
jgi:hypothetical protein